MFAANASSSRAGPSFGQPTEKQQSDLLSPASSKVEDGHGSSSSTTSRSDAYTLSPRPKSSVGTKLLSRSNTTLVAWIRSLPREVRELSHAHDAYEKPLVAKIDHDSGYNVVVSNTNCYIWDLNDTSSTPTCYTFPLPKSTRPSAVGAHFSLPTISLSKSDDHTSLLASVSDGQVWYWENIELCFADYKEPTKATIPLLADDECAFVEHVGTAGYFAVSKKANVFRIAITKPLGGSGVSAIINISQLVVSVPGAVATSLMNRLGISALAGGDQKAVAVTSGPKIFDRNDKWELIVMTGQTLIRWSLAKAGGIQGASKEPEIYIRDIITTQIKRDFPQSDNNVLAWNPRVRLLDVAYLNNKNNGGGNKLVVLASFFKTGEITSATPLFYGLFTVSAPFGQEYSIEHVSYVQHHAEEDIRLGGHPRLAIPNGGPNIFIVTSSTIIVTSTTRDHRLFEDVITLQRDSIIGFGSRNANQWSMDNADNSSELNLIFRESGYIGVQVTMVDSPKMTMNSISGRSEQSTSLLKETLEQAVHFGSQPDNPLSFDLSRFDHQGGGDLSQAAMEVSRQILRSHSQYIQQLGLDVTSHLQLRIERAEAVIKAIRTSHMVAHLSTDARFELCMNVEKLRAAAALWKEFQRLKDSSAIKTLQPSVKRTAVEILNSAAAECLEKNEASSSSLATSTGTSTEEALATFVKRRVENLGDYLCKVIQLLVAAGQKHGTTTVSTRDLNVTVGGALLAALHAAYSYRTTHIELYQLKNNCDVVAWTATEKMSASLNDIYRLLLSECTTHEPKQDSKNTMDTDDLEPLERADRAQLVKTEAGQFADAYLQGYSERLNHMQNSRDPMKRAAIKDANAKYELARKEIVKALVNINQTQKAIQLAEKYKDWNTLVELIHSNKDKIDYCMREYKQHFADALFSYYDAQGEKAKLLEIGERYKHELSSYFQRYPQPELSWLHEVYLKDYASAAHAAQSGGVHETNVDRRMTMLSLAKLLDAASTEDVANTTTGAVATEAPPTHRTSFGITSGYNSNTSSIYVDDELELASLQHWLIREWESKVGMIKDVDERALEIVQGFSSPVFKKQKTLSKMIQRSIETLLSRHAIDSESLIDIVMLQGQHAVHGIDVYQVCLGICLHASDIPDSRRPCVLQDIWRRVFIADDDLFLDNNMTSLSERETCELLQRSGMAHAYQAAVRATGGNEAEARERLILNPQESLSTMTKDDFEKRFGSGPEAKAVHNDYALENQELQRRMDQLRLNELWQQAQRFGKEDKSSSLSQQANFAKILEGEDDERIDEDEKMAMEMD